MGFKRRARARGQACPRVLSRDSHCSPPFPSSQTARQGAPSGESDPLSLCPLCRRLRLKDQQEREIVHVLVDCCLQEKTYNPFYAFLAGKFCEYQRRFQVSPLAARQSPVLHCFPGHHLAQPTRNEHPECDVRPAPRAVCRGTIPGPVPAARLSGRAGGCCGGRVTGQRSARPPSPVSEEGVVQPASPGECLFDLRWHQLSRIFLSISADWRGNPQQKEATVAGQERVCAGKEATLLRARPDLDTAPNTSGLRLGDLL